MKSLPKFPQFTIKHVEPIKIRTQKVSARTLKKPSQHPERTAASHQSVSSKFTQNSIAWFTSENFKITSNVLYAQNGSARGYFDGIREIQGKSENEEDSVIVKLSELLGNTPKNKGSEMENKQEKKFRIKLKERTIPLRTERGLVRVASCTRIGFK